MEIIISLTYHIYYHFHYLFISFHIKSSLLIEVLLLQSYIYARVYNSKDGSHLQRLTWNVVVCPSRIWHYNQNFNKNYVMLFGIWDGGGDAFGSENLIVKSIDRFYARIGRVGQSEVWTAKPD